MSVENWKFWMVPFAAWGVALAWYSGYQSGYQEGHQTAWEMAHPRITMLDADLTDRPISPTISSFQN